MWLRVLTNLLFMPESWLLIIYRYLLRRSNAKNLTVFLLWLIPHPEGSSCIKLRRKEQDS